jgi:hypothetical protein
MSFGIISKVILFFLVKSDDAKKSYIQVKSSFEIE